MNRLWIPGCLTMLCALCLLALFVPAVPTMHRRMVTFCELYERHIDCPAWVQDVLREDYDLAKECHEVYPPGKDVQMFLCLEEYGF